MRKILGKGVLLLALFCFSVNSFALKENLYDKFGDYPEIKIYLDKVISDVNNPHVKTRIFEDIFDTTLTERVNMKFVRVNDAQKADVVIKAELKGYIFNKVAMPLMFSTATLLADAASSPKSTSTLVVDWKIMSPTNDELLLEYRRFTTLERRPMRQMEGDRAFALVAKKNINRFLYKVFYKPEKPFSHLSRR